MITIEELLKRMQNRKEYLEKELRYKILDRYNSVVISKDHYHFIAEKDGRTDVQVLSPLSDPVHLTETLANEIAEHDIAFKGVEHKEQIIWEVMKVRDFYSMQLKMITDLLEIFKNR